MSWLRRVQGARGWVWSTRKWFYFGFCGEFYIVLIEIGRFSVTWERKP